MILGRVTGKVTTNQFTFSAEEEVKKFDYVQVLHKSYGYVLCQIVEVEKSLAGVLSKCVVVGYKDEEDGKVKPLRIPFEVGTEILIADDDFIKEIINLENPEKGAYIGKLDGKNIEVKIDLSKLLTKHVAVLAKSGAGKSYTVGVLLEEIIDKKVPLLIIDPHGEYSELKNPNDLEKDKLLLHNLKPKGFKNINEYGDTKINSDLRPLKLNENLTSSELVHLLPGRPTGTQMGILYNTLKSIEKINFPNVLLALDGEDNNAKWMIVNNIEYLNNLDLFSPSYSSYNELISSGKASIINLRGVPPDVQEIIVYKLLKDLFELRKQNKVPPFFTVIEEAHNYCPERSFGETKCSKIIRTIASEGRKFGLGLCVVTQRPARIDKSVVSQCTTQIILKVTNPNDLKAISSSVEGITSESEEEIRNLTIGTAMLTGITDIPLFINVRPRMTSHGGQAVDLIENQGDFLDQMKGFEQEEMLPVIKPKTSINDLNIMSDDPIKNVIIDLVPCYLFSCKEKGKDFNLLVEQEFGNIVSDIEEYTTKKLPELESMSNEQIRVLKFAFSHKRFLEEDAVKSTGLDSSHQLNQLIKKGLLEKENNYFYLSNKYIFSNLSEISFYDKPNFEKISYSEKLIPKISLDLIKDKISRFTEVLDQQECFVVKYKLIKG